MELIKKIKEAETQARTTIEQAKAQAAKNTQNQRENHRQTLADADQQRKKSIEAAVKKAEQQALAEIEKLNTQAEKNRKQLQDNATDKIPGAVKTVMDYLKG
jgi:vacuolar-type H+-ATPase subunit H